VTPPVKTIVIGNLSLGGTGKTPHAALILGMLEGKKSAFLSRGYGRKSKGTIIVAAESTAESAGDEPLLIARKFPDVQVVVAGNRLDGIEHILRHETDTDIVILDDALQHRKITGGLNLLLTTWQEPFFSDYVLPAGNLRDAPIRAKAAHAIIVTKCPTDATEAQKSVYINRLAYLGVPVFFSRIAYGKFRALFPLPATNSALGETLAPDLNLLLVTGIANPELFVQKVASERRIAEHFAYRDHHTFSKSDFQRFRDFIGSFAPGRAALLTTEKDAMRMMNALGREMLGDIPAYYQEIEARLDKDSDGLKKMIVNYAAYP
jgi:tetraacyldisaccharide 4'-kinase